MAAGLLWTVLLVLVAVAQSRLTTTTRQSSISSSGSSTTLSARTTTRVTTSSTRSTTLSTLSTVHTSSSSSVSSRTSTTSSVISSRTTTTSTTSITTALPTTTTSTTSTTALPTTTTSQTNACPSAASSGFTCPSAWSTIIRDLAPSFRDNAGQCTDMARAAIRYAFHDAAGYSSRTTPYYPSSGGADGSLLLSATEIGRADNAGLETYHANLTAKYNAYKADCTTSVGAADLIQVVGWLGVLACPGGQLGRVYVGRNDTDQAAPDGLLPVTFGPGSDHDTIFQLFQDKGFSARDLAALMGAHSTSKAFHQTQHGIPAGTPQDSTPGVWDSNYYTEIYNAPAGVGRFESDINLSNTSTTVGAFFAEMTNFRLWQSQYSSSHQKLSLLGLDPDARFDMQDCTSVVARAFA